MARIKSEKNFSKKEVILKSAALLFRTKGFSAASMRSLAEAVGVEAPSLYNHIGSKNHLLQDICFRVANSYTGHMDEVEILKTGTQAKIESILRFHIDMMMQYFDEVYVANHEWKYLPEPLLSNFLNQRRAYEKRFTAIVEEGIRKKELKKLNPYTTVLTCLSALRGLEFWQRNKKNVSAQQLEDDMVALLLHGIIKN